ncbi:MAG: hypothetical protein ABSG80_01370 [Verrucomicrobiota bacterium]
MAVFLLSTFSSHAVPGDEHWDAQFGWPGPGGFILAVTTHNGRLYVSGTGVSNTNTTVQVWDGAQWSSIGQFSGPPITVIYDLAFVGDTLYAGGVFTNVNGVAATCLAKWDGNTWSSVSLNGAVYALAVDGGNLYAAGYFTTNADGLAMNRIGRWDGSTWSVLGSGLGTNFDQVGALAVTNGIVYAGGSFTNAGSLLVSNVARWDGVSWSALGSGLNSTVTSLMLNGSNLYAGGLFGSSPYSGVAKWDGANWSLVGNGFNSGAQSIAVFNNLICATGSFTNAGSVGASRFAVWNGVSWAGAGSGLSAQGGRVYPAGANLYVGGNFLTAGNKLMNGLTAWDGTNWNAVGTAGQINGIYASVRALAGNGTNLYTGGSSFYWAGQTNVNLIGRFDGTNWYPLGTGISGSSVISGPIGSGILTIALTNNYVYAGGYFTNAGGVPVTNIASWNGTNWSAMGSGPGGVVASLLVRSNGVYAVGAPFYNVSYYNTPFFSRWDGSSWQGVAINFPPYTDWETSIGPNLGMAALACIGTNIFIGGYFYLGEYTNPPSGYVGCNNIMRFDGTYGWVMGTGLSSNVTTMAVISTNLYVAGQFTNAGGVAASKIALWNGNYWTNLGSGLVGSGVINGLATMGGNLYAGGTFTNMGGTPVNRIAKWDGTNWSALGNGATYPGLSNPSISGLGVLGNSLYASGSFRMMGDKPSFYIARWNEQKNFDTPQISPLFATNGLFRMRLFGIGGQTNLIQATTNFSTWTPILTNSAGIYDFTDPNSAVYRFRFYRAALGP